MGRAVVVIAVLLALAACGRQKVADPPVAPSSSAAQTSSAPPSPSGPPTMPAVASQHTAAGAKAFALYYWDVVNYAQQTLDTTTLKSLADKYCSGCAGGANGIDDLRQKGGTIQGGNETAVVKKAAIVGGGMALLVMNVTTADEVVTVSASAKPYPHGTDKFRMLLSPQQTGWLVDRLETLG